MPHTVLKYQTLVTPKLPVSFLLDDQVLTLLHLQSHMAIPRTDPWFLHVSGPDWHLFGAIPTLLSSWPCIHTPGEQSQDHWSSSSLLLNYILNVLDELPTERTRRLDKKLSRRTIFTVKKMSYLSKRESVECHKWIVKIHT